MTEKNIEQICEALAARIGDDFPTFEGFDVRADAGESGMIYVALRKAKRETEVGSRLADALAQLVGGELEAESDIDFAISRGQGNKDLLLQIELRKS